MRGMSKTNGTLLTADDHLAQSVNDIVTTLIGTRICRRDYGSIVPVIIDQPANLTTKMQLISSTATALIRWEPRLKIQQVIVQMTEDAAQFWQIIIKGTRTDTGVSVSIGVPLGAAA